MGWFDEQIKQRKQNDDEMFAEAFAGIAGAVTGEKISALNSEAQKTKNAVDEILHYYRVKPCEVPDSVKDINERLEYLLRPHGVPGDGQYNRAADRSWINDTKPYTRPPLHR